ncbi:MAG: hypothetical protein HKP58_02595 [Desulfatitalea sp.]|nr:hypothetical protein [Desulfatitalea sp.]NNJ99279.1 hypothetical protein [Desulfatitalea sp.]
MDPKNNTDTQKTVDKDTSKKEWRAPKAEKLDVERDTQTGGATNNDGALSS